MCINQGIRGHRVLGDIEWRLTWYWYSQPLPVAVSALPMGTPATNQAVNFLQLQLLRDSY